MTTQLDLFADTPDVDPLAAPVPATFKPTALRPATTATPSRPATRPPMAPTSRSAPKAPTPSRYKPRHFSTRSDGATFGEAIADAWHGAHGGNRMDIPFGIVALLALWPHKAPGAALAREIGDFITDYPAERLPAGYAEVIAHHWVQRPDLIDTAAPILRWTEEEHDKQTLRAVKAVTDAAIRHGVLLYTGDSDPAGCTDIDLMSWTITNLRHHSARSGLGEYHTPPEICELLTRMVNDAGGADGETTAAGFIADDVRAGQSLLDPCAGTGGMFRGAAVAQR